MTEDQATEAFTAAHPRALDFPQAEYEADKGLVDRVAADQGYRLAGYRLNRAVFTTKQPRSA